MRATLVALKKDYSIINFCLKLVNNKPQAKIIRRFFMDMYFKF